MDDSHGSEDWDNTYLHPHSVEIVQTIDHASNISTMPHLIRVQVMLEESAIDVVIRWITIDISVEEKGVERKSPVTRRGMVCVSFPFSPVLGRFGSGFVFIKIIAHLLRPINQSCGGCGEQRQ